MIFERVFRWVIRISFIISIVLYCLGIFCEFLLNEIFVLSVTVF